MERLLNLIDELHIEDLRNPLHPSIFDENEGYDMLIVRLPVFKEALDVVSTGFVITPGSSYLYDKSAGGFQKLDGRFEGPHRVIDVLVDGLLKSFGGYQERVVDMEEMLYSDRMGEHFMTRWLELKRDVLRIERVLQRASETMKRTIEYYEEAADFPINSYVDLHEHIDRIMRSATLHLGKLDYLYNFHNARTNEKMNRLIYVLTIISAVFLPLNLVVGFFGMNTSGLPFAEGAHGTLEAAVLMVSLALAFSGGFYLWQRRA